jgi:hypothetical protein
MTIKEVKDLIKAKLEADIALLPDAERIPVEYPRSVDGYKLNHPRASYLLVYRGAKLSENNAPNVLVQDRDIEISVIAVVRSLANGKTAEEHLDFIADSIAGLEVETMRPDGRIQITSEEWIKEEDGIWWYAITFKIPLEFVQVEYRNA